jgi:N-6 DNA Methylase
MQNDVKEFIKKLNEREFSKGEREKFLDFVELAFCAFAKRMVEKERGDKLEARYMQIVNSYRDKDAVRAYPELIGMVAKNVPHSDFLGEVASEIGALNSKQGQFFTPYTISQLMAKMTLGEKESVIEEKGYITVQEPACGGGGMILAVAETLLERGYNPCEQLFVHATDVSAVCYWMTYLQCTLAGIPAQVVHGNTLTLETFEMAYTHPAVRFFGLHGDIFKKSESQPLKAERQDDSSILAFNPPQAKQLALF